MLLISVAALAITPSAMAHDNTKCVAEDFVCHCSAHYDYNAGRYERTYCHDSLGYECNYSFGVHRDFMVGAECPVDANG